jgi:predicted anti-sigma-YlaC factor YlaD
MPHVDEGLLHAYLDGALDALLEAGALPDGTTRASIDAHLAACADCRALLEAERAIRTRAGAVLDTVAPVVDVPPFSELFAMHRARPRRRALPLAWAASVLLAVGAGWWGSELFRNQIATFDEIGSAAPSAPALAESARALNEADARQLEAGSSSLPAPPVAPPAVAGSATGAGSRDAASAGGVVAGRTERTGLADEVRAGDLAATRYSLPPPAAEGVRPRQSDVTRRAAEANRVNRVAGVTLDSIVVTAAADSTLVRRTVQATAAALAAAPVPSPPPPAAAQQEAFRARADDGSDDEFRRQLAELDAGRIPLTADIVPAELPRLQLDGGSAPTVKSGGIIGSSLARTTQQTPDGVDIEIVAWRQTAVALDEIVVTGGVQRDSAVERTQRRRAEAEVAQKQRVERTPFAHTVVREIAQPDGRNQLLLRSTDGTVFVALRARLPAAQLQELSAHLVEVRRQ